MPETDKCPQCGTPLSPGALTGLCPACLLKAGAAADTVTDPKQPPFQPPAITELAAKFPQLEILELIGQGGMGAVYKARQKQLDRIVALKILPPGIGNDAAFAERFTREARALAKLNHPNIVTLYEFGEASGQYYFLMEFVDGVNLRQLLQASRISSREALAIVPQICDALQFAHDHGIVHRDIKPENILLDRRGRVKVADFGLAKIIVAAVYDRPSAPLSESESPSASPAENLTDAGRVMGTPRYMSPEQNENPGEVDHRADIYALGVVFYQMLTGELPGKKIEPPSKKVQIDVRLDEIVLRALEKKPELRFQQASVMKTQVETIAETAPTNKTAPPLLKKPDTFLRWFAVTTLAMVIVLLVIAMLGLIAGVAIPNFIKARERSLALHQQPMRAITQGGSPTNFFIGQTYFPKGDSIEITSVERTENQMTVKGHYNLVSADNATIALHITSRTPYESPTDPSQSMPIAKGKGNFELTDNHVVPGLPHVNMYYSGRPLAEVYFGTRAEAEEEDQLHLTSEKNHPDPEDTYTITSVMQILNPVNPADMDDDFQDVRLLARENESSSVEITYYPLYHPSIGENPNWRQEDAGMKQYLQPTPTENWDEAMRLDLLSQLRQADIDPERLTDKQLAERVSRWAMKRAHTTSAFSIWAVYFPNGQPTVYPLLREAFDRQKPDANWTDQQMFDQEVLGRSMFYNKVHGSCTSSSVYLATIFRALGIPTRLVFCIPPFDPNDDAQSQMFYDHIKNNQVRETVRSALNGTTGFDNHVFNEVYVGHQWVRLNYDTLGQPILDQFYFGLLTHVYTSASLSAAGLAQTWGMRYFDYQNVDQPKLSSINPYRLISVQDHFGTNANLSNPPVPTAELTTVTIIGLLNPDSPAIPPWAADYFLKNPGSGIDFLIAGKEWIPGVYNQMRAFQKHVGHEFLLTATNHPNIKVHLSGLNQSSGDGSFQAYGAQIVSEDKALLAPGVSYHIQPINISDTYRWQVASNITYLAPQNAASNSSEIKTDPDQSLSNQPPVVVETSPLAGAREVASGEIEIRVRFSKEMADGSWSWSTAWENSTPEFIGSPHYDTDGKTCVVRVKLEPGQTYGFWLNSDNFQNFKDRDGRPAVPYLLIFQTKPK